jgi:serine/threonine-protein kinase
LSAQVGTLLSGRYRLDAQIGTGGMSTVYRSFDTVLERVVAIKVMHREITSDSAALERFRREARAVAQLSHPHIVSVIDAGEDSGTPYIVFEYVDGLTLKERIRAGQLPISEAVAYAIEIARALGAAHDRRIVHRDVKPQNVLIDEEGRAKITDFGIARSLTEEGLTLDGRVLGTTDYVSPEQALGHRVDVSSDLYSLGVVLYEMLVGDVPFRGETPVAVAMRHVREELPDVQAHRPEVSAALAAVIERATAKDLAKRYRSATAMAADLEEVLALETARSGEASGEATQILRTLPATARRRLPWRLRHPIWLGAVLLLVTAAVLALLAQNTHRGAPLAPNVQRPAATVTAVDLSANAAHQYNPYGNVDEHPETEQNAVDGDTATSWTTEQYLGGNLGKPGVGIYVDASPGVAARDLVVNTPTPGFRAQVWGANSIEQLPFGDPTSLRARGWTKLAGTATVQAGLHFTFNARGKRYRYYLLWIIKLPLPLNYASISELTLFR